MRLNAARATSLLIVPVCLFLLSSPLRATTCRPSAIPEAPNSVATALVFSGGGAKGAYEAGVAHVFASNGIPITLVAGSSAGAFNATLVAAGQAGELEELWTGLSSEQLFRLRASIWLSGFLPGWLTLWTLNQAGSLFDVAPLRSLLEARIDLERVKRSSIRLLVVATDLAHRRKRSFDNHTVSYDALLASVAMPGAFPPVEVDGELLFDGGFVGRAPVIEALEKYPGVAARVIVIVSYAEGEGGEPPVTIRRAVESAFEMAQTHQILRDVELARLKFPSVEIQLLQPSRPLNLRPLEFSPPQLAEVYNQGKADAATCLTRLQERESEGATEDRAP